MINVVNKKTFKGGGVYIGRPSPLGNPYTHIADRRTLAQNVVKTRDEAVAKYAEWLVMRDYANNGAASVLIAFPVASRWIVTEKPGLKSTGLATVLTGCNYQVPGLEELETEVEVVDVTTEKNGKQWVRKAICGAVDGQLSPQSNIYPENMIGLIAVNADQPEKGAHFARIKKVSSGAWQCVLVRS
jgi:hypothetical protein